jgi:hypothetical protein
MHLPYWVHRETGRLRAVLVTLLILASCTILLLSEHSQELYGIDELYGILD